MEVHDGLKILARLVVQENKDFKKAERLAVERMGQNPISIDDVAFEAEPMDLESLERQLRYMVEAEAREDEGGGEL